MLTLSVSMNIQSTGIAMKYISEPCLSKVPPLGLTNCSMSTRQPLDVCSIQLVALSALQSKAVDVEQIEGTLFRYFRLRTESDSFYLLKCYPSNQISLLRHERGRLQAEANVLEALQHQIHQSIPRLIAFNSNGSPLGNSYLISGPFRGTILSDVEHTLPRQALYRTDHSIGQYVRRLSDIPGPHFGPVNSTAPGLASWSWYFRNLVETALQDGEDALVGLPYGPIRDYVRVHHDSLDQITESKLVVVETAGEKNILIDAQTYRVSGLLDFSTAIWGDPYISDCFYKPSASFVEGFGRLPNESVHEQTRQYLYIIYHSVLAIVRSAYRPSEDSEELEARRNLTIALTQLSNFHG